MNKVNCLVCGAELKYKNDHRTLTCDFCKDEYDSNVECKNGHFVCDTCHSLDAYELISTYCVKTTSKDPIAMAITLMKNPKLKMHGPEHHFLVPAVLLASYYNVKNDPIEKQKKIKIARDRAIKILGGFCGYYGTCGAAVGSGIFVSLITDSNPLSKEEWRQTNLITAKCLFLIANAGGPRCCKRNTFLAIIETSNFLASHLKTELPINKEIRCEFNSLNKECIQNNCPFYYLR